MTDSTGVVVWAATYEPFGKATITVEQITNNLRFPGQYFDSETGTHNNWNRDYNLQLGRYIESDPIGLEGGINLYTYVTNRPTIYIDPTGLWSSLIHEGTTADAARAAGCSKIARELGKATADVDNIEGSNDPRQAYWHAMVNGDRAQDAPGRANEIQRYYNHVYRYSKSCDPKLLAFALHAVQDSYAPAHSGFQPWHNKWYEYLPHSSDLVLSPGGARGAFYDSRQIIETAKENCPCLCK